MKILIVTPAYEPAWALGGVVSCLSNLCRAMVNSGACVSLYTINTDGQGGVLDTPTGQEIDLGGVKVTYFPSNSGKSSVWSSQTMMRKMEETLCEFDIVYIAAVWQWLGIKAGALANKHSVPYVIGPHGSFDTHLFNQRYFKKLVWWHLFLKKWLAQADALHLTTEYERRQSSRLKSKFPNFIVPNCLTSKAFEASGNSEVALREKFQIKPDAPVLLAMGRPDPKKRYDLVLASFLKVSAAFPDARLLIVGPYDNEYGQKMKSISENSAASDSIIWTGYLSGELLQGCFAAADLFLLPSIDENFGMVVVEAMAVGVPVVVSNHVGVADDVEQYDAGVVIEVDQTQLEDAIINLLESPENMKQKGENAIKAAKDLYAGQMVAKNMIRAFDDILTETKSPECHWQ